MATAALCALLHAQPALLDLIPSMGHIPRLCNQMSKNVRRVYVPKASIEIMNLLSKNDVSSFILTFFNVFSWNELLYT